MKNRRRTFAYLAVATWMIVIFMFSHQPSHQSELQSGRIQRNLNSRLGLDWDMHTTRKSAHVISYFVLGLLLYAALYDRGWTIKRTLLAAIIIASLYAVTDEIHQNFVPGRSMQLTDVLIDTSGAAFGAGIYAVFVRNRRMI